MRSKTDLRWLELDLTRANIGALIVDRLQEEQDDLQMQFSQAQNKIGYCYIDNVLPVELAQKLFDLFPDSSRMKFNSTLRERKYIAAQMDQYDKLLEEALFAFQEDSVIKQVSRICNIPDLQGDPYLYAGGLSLMNRDCFLNPHLDNCHDKDRQRWRALNLLFYVTPNWNEANGGHLEVWPDGLGKEPQVIHSKFNRLAIMATHDRSWHSVNPVTVEGRRCCISNYYFTPTPSKDQKGFHVTRFRARPEQKLRDICLRMDATIRTGVRLLKKDGLRKLTHLYRQPDK